MSDLAAFLNARLNEDQAAAEAAAAMLASAEPDREADLAICFDDGTSGNAFDWNPWDRVAAYDPARVLREVEARRKILAECQRRIGDGINFTLSEQNFAEDVVRALAAVYSDHPDYDQEWA